MQVAEGIAVSEAQTAAVCESASHGFQPNHAGFDAVEFLLAAGPAEPLRPLASVASGALRSLFPPSHQLS